MNPVWTQIHTLIFRHGPHAALNKTYDIKSKRQVILGKKGTYGQIDPETEAEYRVIGEEKDGEIFLSKDFTAGSFYPNATFVLGRDEKSQAIPHDALEAFLNERKIFTETARRALLPRGWRGSTGWEWENAFFWAPPSTGPNWWTIKELFKQKFPDAEVEAYGLEIWLHLS